MHLEVEQKHVVVDLAALERRLLAEGVAIGPPAVQVDRYFAHPLRDFARTDEALRIRTVGDASFITYKGPKLDAATKTRRELELPLETRDPAGAEWAELLAVLGFSPVETVRKTRRPFAVPCDGQQVHGALDTVDHVGTFVELEITTDEAHLAAARRAIASLADRWRLGPIERRSYLELLLAAGDDRPPGEARAASPS